MKWYLVGLAGGLLLGAPLSVWLLPWVAEIAFKVRPGLASLSFWEAMFSGHLVAWLFIFHKGVSIIVSMSLFALWGGWAAIRIQHTLAR